VTPTPSKPVILAIDQGTTGTTALLVDRTGSIVGRGYREVPCVYPHPGWVEQDAEEVWQHSLEAIAEALRSSPPTMLAGIGITNQRETTVLWDRHTGKTVAPSIVWQCRRTAPLCEQLQARGLTDDVRQRTGLVVDPYFSATKIRWLFDNVAGVAERAQRGEICFGTVDSWLLWKLSGGAVHRTDYTNASRTMLFNIDDRRWDNVLLRALEIPASILPEVGASSGNFGFSAPLSLPGGDKLASGIPLAGVAGDQQAALFGQACFMPGTIKCTYGTGAFLLQNIGHRSVRSRAGLLTTLACGPNAEAVYALEGSVFIAGAAIQWLRDQLGLIHTASESEALARSVPDNGGVYLVPAFVGLGAPYWDPSARGAILGLTRGTDRRHLVRAALEAIAYQTRDVIDAMTNDAGEPVQELRVDGGAAANDFLNQFQADILGVPVLRPATVETTALGAAYLAGLAVGFWRTTDEIARHWRLDRRFEPASDVEQRDALYRGWRQAVAKVTSPQRSG